MDHEIDTFLCLTVTPEVRAILHKATTVFNTFELPDHEDSILDLIYSTVDQEEQTVAVQVIAEFRSKIEYILGLHDITMLDSAPLELLIDLCMGLKAIDDYLDMDSVIDICDGEELSMERFADIMALVTPYTADEITLHVDVINEGLIEKIRNLVQQAPEEASAGVSPEMIAAINKYRLQIAPDELSYQVMLDASLPLGMPFKTYLDFYSNTNKNIDLSDALHLKQFVMDLIGLVLISSDGHANPIMMVQQTLGTFTSDISISMRADILAKRILQQFTTKVNNEKN